MPVQPALSQQSSYCSLSFIWSEASQPHIFFYRLLPYMQSCHSLQAGLPWPAGCAAREVSQTQGTQYLLKSDFRLSNFFLSSWDMKPAGMKGEGCKPSSAPRTLRPGTLERPLVVQTPPSPASAPGLPHAQPWHFLPPRRCQRRMRESEFGNHEIPQRTIEFWHRR